MKLTKKKILVAALAVGLIATVSLGSIAWFSDTDKVENKFYIASSDDDNPDDIFSVDVWENTPDGDSDPDGFEYSDIQPGDILKKEANVENTGHYDQYVRVKIKVTDADAWLAVLDKTAGTVRLADIVDGYESGKWEHGSCEVTSDDKLVFTIYLKDVLTSGNSVEVFKNVKIPADMTTEQAAAFDNEFGVDVVADAVQTQNVGSSCYEAFQTVGI